MPNDERFRRPPPYSPRQAGSLLKKSKDLLAPQLTGDDNLARTIHAVNLEYVLGEINADGVNMHVDDPLRDLLFNDHPFGTFDAWSGRRPPHQSRSGGASSLECVGAGLGVRWHRRPG